VTSADTAPISPDTHIVRALAHDLDTGFIRLFETYRHVVFSVVLRICGRWADAEDLTAEAFLRAYRALSTYRGGRLRSLNPKAWLLTIALNVCRNDDRTAGRHRYTPLADQADVLPDVHQNVEEVVTNRETGAELATLLATLPADQRAAIVLRHIADLPIAEIAEILGRPENTIKSDIKRGLTRLRATYPSHPGRDHIQSPADRDLPQRPRTSRPTAHRLPPRPAPPGAAHSSSISSGPVRTAIRPAADTPGDLTPVAVPPRDRPQPPRPTRVPRRNIPNPGTPIRPADDTPTDLTAVATAPSRNRVPPPGASRVAPHNAPSPGTATATAPRPPPAADVSPDNHSSEPRPEPAGGSP
jgi:RNA polymerase sigma-70 factor (ECF subfamily)